MQTLQTELPLSPVHGTTPDAPSPAARPAWARFSWTGTFRGLAHLLTAFVLSVLGFVLLVPLFALGLATAVTWAGVPILGFTLLLASGFAREGRDLLDRTTGDSFPAPRYRQSATGPVRLVRMVADPQLWRDMTHAVVVALPLRTATVVVAASWLAAGVGGVTSWLWSVFVPGYQGLASLLLPLLAPQVPFHAHLADSLVHGVLGAVLLLTTPALVRLLVSLDAVSSRALLVQR
ncbi:sensor domain-containing protein [Pseudactinotalea sp. Z1732]|uniref:sensor domain-containing protein n=1 Tax=Micrococcales TaxID=85006 RepID=UPI003C7B6FFB